MTLLKTLLIVAIVVIVLVLILVVVLMWKMNKDIKDMKSGLAKLLKSLGKENADQLAACFVDACVKAVGYMRFKELYSGKATPTADEAVKLTKISIDCKITEEIASGGSTIANAVRQGMRYMQGN
jgi:predicted Holliday junction resolvase-like endonuclease